MRLHRLRFDIWFCLLVAYLVSLGTGAAASALSAATYDGYAEVHSAAPGQAGSPAGPEVPRAQSIAELLELDTRGVLVSSWHVPVFRNAATRSRFCIRSVLSALNAAVKLSSARQKRAVFFMAVPIIRNVNLHHGTGQQKKNVRNAVK